MTSKHNLVRNAFALLRVFKCADERLSCIELSRRARLPRASGHRLVKTLEEIGAITKAADGKYCLGLLMSSLSRNVATGKVLRELGSPVMRALAAELNVTVHMGILEDGMVTYVAKEALPTSLAVPTCVGVQSEAYCSGLGKVLLAALPDESLDNFLSVGDLAALTPRTITNAGLLRRELEKARVHGFAIDNGEYLHNMFSLAAPIRDRSGHTIAALSATDDVQTISADRQDHLRRRVLAAAGEITMRIGPRHGLECPERPLAPAPHLSQTAPAFFTDAGR